MQLVSLHDKDEIERFLRRDVYLNIYALGDLDDFYWPHTVWYALRSDGEIHALALLYLNRPLPALLALSEPADPIRQLLESVKHLLPPRFHAHLNPGLDTVFHDTHSLEPHGEHHKMALLDAGALAEQDCSGVIQLTEADLEEVQRFYEQSYPNNWFDPRMLQTNRYFGIREDGQLTSVAGVHACSAKYKVAALGNIATHGDHRGRGFAKKVTAKL
ncbi:MAG: GNAT family N-acetyltransferase, partial [Planctomycetota bacterium]